jgi:S-DNA-T family DNA segregation ATPase FtsK/SpoIIIE
MAAAKSKTISRTRPDATAFALFVSGIFVAISIFGTIAEPDPTQHLLGPVGSWLGIALIESLGTGVFVLVAGWFVLTALLFLVASTRRWFLRLSGWLILLPSWSAIADQVGPVAIGVPAGGGGTIGAAMNQLLADSLTPPGRLVLFATIGAVGLLLAADSLLYSIARLGGASLRFLGWWSIRRVRSAIGIFGGRKGGRPRMKTGASSDSDIETVDMSRDLGLLGSTSQNAGNDLHLSENFSSPRDMELPPCSLLEDPDPFPHEEHDSRLREQAALLEKTFADLNLKVRVAGYHTGPVITQYEVALDTGLRVNKVTVLGDDLALKLKVPSVRIIANTGKDTVGIEVPNEHRAIVRLKELITAAGPKIGKSRLPLLLGKDTEGRPLVYDLAEMPHLLIAGRTGTGKSVCLNAVILSLLLTKKPDECRMIMIDPKQVEFSDYARIPHLMCPVVTQNSKAEAILAWAVDKMEERYSLLARARVRNIGSYNTLDHDELIRRIQPKSDEEKEQIPERMPYIVIVIDEIGDLMMEMKKEVEGHIIRLAQKSRAAGIHLILATQRPTVDVITGLIKSNLPARICFQVSSRSDSRVVLDENGADKLLGKGDMLFLQPGTSTLIRAQGAYASDQEILRVVNHLECEPDFAPELLELKARPRDGDSAGPTEGGMRARDPLYEQAVEVIVREGRGSVSLLQRALGIGYGKAARFIDYMAEDGVVGHYNGSQAREVLISPEQWEQMRERSDSAQNAN